MLELTGEEIYHPAFAHHCFTGLTGMGSGNHTDDTADENRPF